MLKGVPAVAIVGALSARWSIGPPLTTTTGCFFPARGRNVGLTTNETRLTIVFATRLPVLSLTTFFTLTSFVFVTPALGFVWVWKTYPSAASVDAHAGP